MELQDWIILALFLGLIFTLVLKLIRPVYAFFGLSILLLLFNVISVKDYMRSFTNESVLSIFLLIFITRIFREQFDIFKWLDRVFQNTNEPKWFLFKKSISVSLLSSIMNNTPIVALMIPYTYQWAEKNNVAVSKLLLPLSYAAITGGMITVIGTSTNLVLNGFLEASGLPTLSWVNYFLPGILVSIGVALYSSFIGYNLLPEKYGIKLEEDHVVKEYLLECIVTLKDGMKSKTVSEFGLRNLDGMFLVEIIRENEVISPVHPDTILKDGDHLFFAGDYKSAVSYVKNHKILNWTKPKEFILAKEHDIIELVIPYNSGLIGTTLKEIGFRMKYNASVIGIYRKGTKLKGKLGKIRLIPGDLLIVIGGADFMGKLTRQKDIYSVNKVGMNQLEKSKDSWKKYIFLLGVGSFVTTTFLSFNTLFIGLLGILTIGLALKLTSFDRIKSDFNIELAIILASAISLGVAVIDSGLGEQLGSMIGQMLPYFNSWFILGFIGVVTVILTSFVTNVAAVSIMFPIVYSLAPNLDVSHEQIFLILAFAASASFITPTGYQTNLMVMEPGRYSFMDYIRFGTPMLLIYTLILIIYFYLI